MKEPGNRVEVIHQIPTTIPGIPTEIKLEEHEPGEAEPEKHNPAELEQQENEPDGMPD
ncbi:hypothetical protein L21SP2_2675 [Salinispira pacifica]|uniref:Uncharacterized protein n=1 Tax=Salinispira pacifica TaxID=1307761 RepID=V5WJR6_9SPIO|nr:hypothetical protein L21SP2_2675 [Salinispira pacifica]